MPDILERLKQLIALAESPNEHEARSAALLAVALIRKHGIVLRMPEPARSSGRHRAAPARETPTREAPAPSRRKTPGSKRVKRVADAPEKITSPLGGECIHCGERYRAQQTVYWFASGGGMHPRCFEEWAKKDR